MQIKSNKYHESINVCNDKNKVTDSMKHRTKKCFKPEFTKSVKNISNIGTKGF